MMRHPPPRLLRERPLLVGGACIAALALARLLYSRVSASGKAATRTEIAESTADDTDTNNAADEVVDDHAAIDATLRAGGRAVCQGLVGRTDLNGQHVTLLSYDADAGRWAVRCGSESVRVRAANLVPHVEEECPVCLDAHEARAMERLACGHPICTSCLQRMHVDAALRACPLCRGALLNVGPAQQITHRDHQRIDKALAMSVDPNRVGPDLGLAFQLWLTPETAHPRRRLLDPALRNSFCTADGSTLWDHMQEMGCPPLDGLSHAEIALWMMRAQTPHNRKIAIFIALPIALQAQTSLRPAAQAYTDHHYM